MANQTKPRLKERYEQDIVPALMKEFNFGNVMRVPKVKKVVLNIGLGEAIANPKALESAEKDLATISGQHPVVTKSKRSIAAFKLRTGMPIGGCMSSWTDWSVWCCPASGTSVVCRGPRSTAAATTAWGSRIN
jgi:hypothetical protein